VTLIGTEDLCNDSPEAVKTLAVNEESAHMQKANGFDSCSFGGTLRLLFYESFFSTTQLKFPQ
jgi:hypothetical protein